MSGYSKKSLVEKIGIREGMNVVFLHVPKDIAEILLVDQKNIHVAQSLKEGEVDYIHIFVTKRVQLEEFAETFEKQLSQKGMIWVSWPKQSSNVPTLLSEQILRDVLLPTGLVDIKVCAIDDTWSALKFVYRKNNKSA